MPRGYRLTIVILKGGSKLVEFKASKGKKITRNDLVCFNQCDCFFVIIV